MFLAAPALRAGDAAAPIAADVGSIKASDELKKPVWLTELSVTVKESFDSNVFLTNADRPGFPKVANVDSFVTSVTPKVVFDLAPLLDPSKPGERTVESLALSYAPEIARYHEAATENYEAHRVGLQLRAHAESFSCLFENTASFVEGNRNTPQYNQVNCFATATVRERRDQIQDRGKLVLRNDWDGWFVRGIGTLLYYDMNTYQYNPVGMHAGWQNYEDRYDVNGGADVGFKIMPDFAVTLGYRHGYQYQQAFSWSGVTSSNDYNRVLGGFEGKPLPWLKIEFQGGPDFHQYETARMQAGHADELTRFYYDGTLSAAVTSQDTLSFRCKQWQWVSSTGVCTYEDKAYEWNWKRAWTKTFSTTAGFQILGAHYDAPTVRSDWQYGALCGVKYEWSPNLAFTADYAYTRGENDADINNLAPGREYDRHLVSLGIKAAF